MYCTHCGAKIPDDAAFCPACGTQISNTSQQNEPTGPSADYTQNQYRSFESQPQETSGTPADVVRNIGRSPQMLAFLIVFSISLVFSIYGFLFSSINVFISMLAFLSQFFVCVGCWLAYANCSKNSLNSTGFSVLRVGIPIYTVLLLLSGVAIIYEMSYMSSGFARLIGIIVSLAILVILAWCFYGLWRVTNDGLKILKGEAVQWNAPLSSIVILIVLAVSGVLSALFTAILSAQFITILQYLTYVAVYVLAIVILFRIRKEGSMST